MSSIKTNINTFEITLHVRTIITKNIFQLISQTTKMKEIDSNAKMTIELILLFCFYLYLIYVFQKKLDCVLVSLVSVF